MTFFPTLEIISMEVKYTNYYLHYLFLAIVSCRYSTYCYFTKASLHASLRKFNLNIIQLDHFCHSIIYMLQEEGKYGYRHFCAYHVFLPIVDMSSCPTILLSSIYLMVPRERLLLCLSTKLKDLFHIEA
jgi:hypothetical protein